MESLKIIDTNFTIDVYQFVFSDVLVAPSPPSRACGGHRGSTSAQSQTQSLTRVRVLARRVGVALGYANVGLVVAARTQCAHAADVEVPGLARQACVAL